MSANNTDPDDKASRHKAPLIGISAAVGFVAVLFIAFLIYLSTRTEGPTRIPPVGSSTSQSD